MVGADASFFANGHTTLNAKETETHVSFEVFVL